MSTRTDLAVACRCASCGRYVPLLVDDGPLCISCDQLLYPEAS